MLRINSLSIIARIMDNELIRLFDWLNFGVVSLIRLNQILTGHGISIERFFANAFVNIDEEMIDIKLGAFEKEYKID